MQAQLYLIIPSQVDNDLLTGMLPECSAGGDQSAAASNKHRLKIGIRHALGVQQLK
jgi:hypothetical protein